MKSSLVKNHYQIMQSSLWNKIDFPEVISGHAEGTQHKATFLDDHGLFPSGTLSSCEVSGKLLMLCISVSSTSNLRKTGLTSKNCCEG